MRQERQKRDSKHSRARIPRNRSSDRLVQHRFHTIVFAVAVNVQNSAD
jgi:hypothetical protein